MYIVIRETYYRITSVVDTFRTNEIFLLLLWCFVIFTIYFDHKIFLDADEISYIISYWMLTSEVIATIQFPEYIP